MMPVTCRHTVVACCRAPATPAHQWCHWHINGAIGMRGRARDQLAVEAGGTWGGRLTGLCVARASPTPPPSPTPALQAPAVPPPPLSCVSSRPALHDLVTSNQLRLTRGPGIIGRWGGGAAHRHHLAAWWGGGGGLGPRHHWQVGQWGPCAGTTWPLVRGQAWSRLLCLLPPACRLPGDLEALLEEDPRLLQMLLQRTNMQLLPRRRAGAAGAGGGEGAPGEGGCGRAGAAGSGGGCSAKGKRRQRCALLGTMQALRQRLTRLRRTVTAKMLTWTTMGSARCSAG